MSARSPQIVAAGRTAAALAVGTVAGIALAPAGVAGLADPVALVTGALASGTVAGLWYASRRLRRRALDALYRARRHLAWELRCHLARRRARRHGRLARPRPLTGSGRRLVFVTAMVAGLLAGLAATATFATGPFVDDEAEVAPQHSLPDPPGGDDPGPIHRLARWLGAFSR